MAHALWAGYPLAHPRAQWYAVHTRSRHEDAVHKRLAGKAIEVFLPKMEVWSRRVDRRKRIQVPLFPGYLFVNAVMDRYVCSEIIRTNGVVQVLGNSEGAVPVPESQIESVRTLLVNNVLPSPHAYLRVGRRVRVINGPLAGCEGILLKKSNRSSRLVIAVDIIRQAVAVEIDASDVEPA
jgi:transcriptional antiterminator NusG